MEIFQSQCSPRQFQSPKHLTSTPHMAIAAFQNFSVGVDAGPTFDLPVDTGSVWL